MKEIQKVVEKLSREQESAAAAPAPAYEPVQKHKVTTVLFLTWESLYLGKVFILGRASGFDTVVVYWKRQQWQVNAFIIYIPLVWLNK